MKNAALIICALCVPYLCTVLWGNAGRTAEGQKANDAVPVFAQEVGGIRFLSADCGWYSENVDLEEYVAECLAAYVPEEMKTETIKAMAVVLRTELAEGQAVRRGGARTLPVSDRYRDAAEETRGITLTYEGGAVNALWTYVSNGSTRDGSENHIASADYLKKKDCRKDILSKEFSSEVSCGKKQFEETLRTLSSAYAQGDEPERDAFGWPVFTQIRDSAGYTKKILFGTDVIEGGEFADAFLLKSPSFDMEFQDEKVIFHVTGCGHGFGMSLYAADRMAAEGKDFMEILSSFYPGTELRK